MNANVTATMVKGSDTFKFDLNVNGALVGRYDTIEEAIEELRKVEEAN